MTDDNNEDYNPDESQEALEENLESEEWLNQELEEDEFGEKRDPSRVVNGLSSNSKSFGFDTAGESLSASERIKTRLTSYAQAVFGRESALQDLVGRVEEKNSREAEVIAEDLLNLRGEVSTVDEDLLYERDPGRTDYTDEGLLSFVEDHATEAEEYGSKIEGLASRINGIQEDIQETREKRENAVTETRNEPGKIQEEDLEEAELDANELFSGVEDAQKAVYDGQLQELNQEVAELEEEHLGPAKEEQAQVLQELDEVYNEYAQDVESFVVTASEAISERVDTLENLAETEVPNTSETYSNKIANDAEQELGELLAETAGEVGTWISQVYRSVVNAHDELETVEDALPKYRDDSDRLERLDEEIEDLTSEDYDSFEDMVYGLVDSAARDYDISDAIDEIDTLLEDVEAAHRA